MKEYQVNGNGDVHVTSVCVSLNSYETIDTHIINICVA